MCGWVCVVGCVWLGVCVLLGVCGWVCVVGCVWLGVREWMYVVVEVSLGYFCKLWSKNYRSSFFAVRNFNAFFNGFLDGVVV